MMMRLFAVFVIFGLLLAGCVSAPNEPIPKAGNSESFSYPIAKVQQAALDALTANGFDVEKNEQSYIQGHRPQHMGLVISSGGETVGVWLTAIDPNSTSVLVAVRKSMGGFPGQRNLTPEVLAAMRKSLSGNE
jgi:hypothetical protein